MKKKLPYVEQWWMLKHSVHGLLPAYYARQRKQVVAKATSAYAQAWDEMKRCGYSVVKVKISEEA